VEQGHLHACREGERGQEKEEEGTGKEEKKGLQNFYFLPSSPCVREKGFQEEFRMQGGGEGGEGDAYTRGAGGEVLFPIPRQEYATMKRDTSAGCTGKGERRRRIASWRQKTPSSPFSSRRHERAL
jgi:hypothetical protein